MLLYVGTFPITYTYRLVTGNEQSKSKLASGVLSLNNPSVPRTLNDHNHRLVYVPSTIIVLILSLNKWLLAKTQLYTKKFLCSCSAYDHIFDCLIKIERFEMLENYKIYYTYLNILNYIFTFDGLIWDTYCIENRVWIYMDWHRSQPPRCSDTIIIECKSFMHTLATLETFLIKWFKFLPYFTCWGSCLMMWRHQLSNRFLLPAFYV